MRQFDKLMHALTRATDELRQDMQVKENLSVGSESETLTSLRVIVSDGCNGPAYVAISREDPDSEIFVYNFGTDKWSSVIEFVASTSSVIAIDSLTAL